MTVSSMTGSGASAPQTYSVAGMTCGGCARSVEQAIREVAPAVEAITVDLEAGTVTVAGGPDAAVIEQAVDDAGFTYGGAAG